MKKKQIAAIAIASGLKWSPAYRLELERFAEAIYAIAKSEEQKRCIKACDQQLKIFLSPQYSAGQPLSSYKERFAVGSCIDAISNSNKE